jgi:hypothetical protein
VRRTFVIVISACLVLTSTSLLVGTAGAAPAPQAKWTVMVYMSGDNNLEDFIAKDLELELAAIGSSASV